mmetsp:Transcript_104866/g.128054  ORF Transcript_104866/g.128054 Transcript_104866/m.128054 type:complete len:199 (+) Transcript_104866:84-680(+)
MDINDAINDIITVYQYCLDKLKLNNKQIVFVGNNSGAGIIMLFLQKIRDNYSELKLKMPLCCVLMSIYVELDSKVFMDKNRYNFRERNKGNDVMISYDKKGFLGNKYGNKIFNDIPILSNNFSGYCPIYFSVAENEVLLGDTLNCIKNAQEYNIDIQMEIHPYLCHSYPIYVGLFDESDEATTRISKYINDKIQQNSI